MSSFTKVEEGFEVSKDTINVLSLGAGTQSSCMALMSAHGDLPKPDYIIFSDTGWEPRHVYVWLEKLKKELKKFGLEVITVRHGNIYEDILKSLDTGERTASMPFFTKNPQTGKRGMVMRQCTFEYKIQPINRKIRELLGYKPKQRVREKVVMWKGITTDEVARIKESDVSWIEFKYPLFERDMDRLDAINYVIEKMGEIPPKSSCIGCPFHNDDMWLDIKQNYPDEWKQAVKLDKKIRHHPKFYDELYLHKSCVPLNEVDLQENQVSFGDVFDDFDNECFGMCGL